MQRIETILKTIKERNINITELSRITGIPNTRIYKWLDGKGKPKVDDAEKLQHWAKKNLEEVPRETGNTSTEATDVDFRKKYLDTVEQQINFLQELVKEDISKMKINLETVLNNQDGGLSWVQELLLRDVRKEAKGNPQKEEQILREIAKRTGIAIGLKLKQGKPDGAGIEHK